LFLIHISYIIGIEESEVKGLDILYEDERVIAVNKPSGLASQGGEGIKTSLDKLLLDRWEQAGAQGGRPLLAHRLDMDTSGLILAAKGEKTVTELGRILGDKTSLAAQAVEKRYLAVCSGIPHKEKGTFSKSIIISGKLKSAATGYKVRSSRPSDDSLPALSLLELTLFTGRTHQIRRHLAAEGLPIIGDDKFGDFKLNKTLRKTSGVKRMLLHAWSLTLPPFAGGDALALTAPPPEYFTAFCEAAGLHPIVSYHASQKMLFMIYFS
jgi:23S rRNA pseudouridine955/2504/2580 synthase